MKQQINYIAVDEDKNSYFFNDPASANTFYDSLPHNMKKIVFASKVNLDTPPFEERSTLSRSFFDTQSFKTTGEAAASEERKNIILSMFIVSDEKNGVSSHSTYSSALSLYDNSPSENKIVFSLDPALSSKEKSTVSLFDPMYQSLKRAGSNFFPYRDKLLASGDPEPLKNLNGDFVYIHTSENEIRSMFSDSPELQVTLRINDGEKSHTHTAVTKNEKMSLHRFEDLRKHGTYSSFDHCIVLGKVEDGNIRINPDNKDHGVFMMKESSDCEYFLRSGLTSLPLVLGSDNPSFAVQVKGVDTRGDSLPPRPLGVTPLPDSLISINKEPREDKTTYSPLSSTEDLVLPPFSRKR